MPWVPSATVAGRRRRAAALAALAAAALTGCAGSGEAPAPPGCDARPQRRAADPPARITTVRLPGRPFDIAIDPRRRWVYASLPSSSGRPRLAVLRRAGARLRLVRVVRLARDLQPLGLHVTAGGRLLVAAGASVIGIERRRLVRGRARGIRRLASGSGLIGVTATDDGRTVFATDESRGELVAVGTTGRVRRMSRVRLAQAPVGLALSRDERHVFVASEFDADWRDAGVLSVVDAQRALAGRPDAVRATAPAGCHPVRVLDDPAHGVVWVSARESNAVLAYDARTLIERPERALLAAIPVGRAPVDMELVAGGRLLAVADSHRFTPGGPRGSVSLVDVRAALVAREALVARARIGRHPRALALLPRAGRLLVAGSGAPTIEVVPRSSLAPGRAHGRAVGADLGPGRPRLGGVEPEREDRVGALRLGLLDQPFLGVHPALDEHLGHALELAADQ